MRSVLAVMLLSAAFAAGAQSQPRPLPPGTTPLDRPPPMAPTDVAHEQGPAPEVTMRMDGDNEIAEYRMKGKLYMMRVKPKNGPAYTLMDHKGDGSFTKQDHTLTPNTSVPQWVLLEF
ncbi:hypothetical protein BWI17_04465 [Betaproteobacteria bacterium GR16-43]|nr:hypothetical protein BWI17_04465 [Betaproteobacteria bacterium GR16-43]